MSAPLFPLPPSANALFVYRHGRRRKTADYKAWRRGAAILARASLPLMPSATALQVVLEVGINRRRDLDNVIKPTLDMLKAANVIEDDCWVDKILAQRSREVEIGWMRVELEML